MPKKCVHIRDGKSNALFEDYVPSESDLFPEENNERLAAVTVVNAEANVMTSRSESYQAEAEKCRLMAAQESCPDAREYYEALQRDYIKLASRALDEQKATL